jgi:hypothetical protein
MNLRRLRNLARQDQVEAMQRNWLEQMSDERLYRLMADCVMWMECNHTVEEKGPPLLVPQYIAHTATTAWVIQLTGEVQRRFTEANDSDSQRGQEAEEGFRDDQG